MQTFHKTDSVKHSPRIMIDAIELVVVFFAPIEQPFKFEIQISFTAGMGIDEADQLMTDRIARSLC